MSRFYGPVRIEKESPDAENENYVVLDLKDGTSVRVTKKMLEASRTREATDLTSLWDRQLAPVVKEMLQTLLDWDVKTDQLDYLVNMLKSSIEHNFQNAQEVLWGTKKHERTMSDVDRVLKSAKKNDESAQPTTEQPAEPTGDETIGTA